MTTFETLCAIAERVLRARGEWHGGATAFADIDKACNGAADLMRGDDMPDLVTLGLIEMAISELNRRAGVAAQGRRFQHAHNWCPINDLVDRCSVCGEERA